MLVRLRGLLRRACSATRDDFFCTLDRRHQPPHEAWTCGCAGHGRCTEPDGLVSTWV